MGDYYGLVVLVGVASLLTTSSCDAGCSGTDGHAGVPGAPGRNGWPGLKGEKGEPAVMASGPVDAGILMRLKGEMGNRGLPGPMGPKGYRGDLGAPGQPGNTGRPGPAGKSSDQGQSSDQQAHSAFSAIRNTSDYPRFNQIVTYQDVVVNEPRNFDGTTGQFTCQVSGVYYFTFHSVAKVSICLNIVTDAPQQGSNKLGFCDYNLNKNTHRNQDQVLSGGVVLQLTAGNKVWLESFKDQQLDVDARDTREKQIIFNGFLLFSN